jgi:chemotaxis protein MotB
MSSGRGRRTKGGHDESSHPDERWMASYMDMVTVLMCMFIVLYAMSSVDTEKYEALRQSLATGFGAEESETADTATGVVVPAEFTEGEDVPTTMERAQLEVDALRALQQQIQQGLDAQGLGQAVNFTLTERGLDVSLIGSDTYFTSNEATLTPLAVTILTTIAPYLAPTPYELSIEGHADIRATSGRFPSNWELSTARATTVLRYLVERGGISSSRVGATGYGSARPLATGPSEAELALNRRVDIVVLSNQPADVLADIPTVLAGG